MKFLAIDRAAVVNGLASSVNIVVQPIAGVTGQDLPQINSGLQEVYQRLNATVISSSTITFAGHRDLQEVLNLPLQTANQGQVTVNEIQDVVPGDGNLYAVTLAGDSPALGIIASTFRI